MRRSAMLMNRTGMTLAVAFLALRTSGCISSGVDRPNGVRRVFYGTDRAPAAGPRIQFTSEKVPGLSLGWALVAVPDDRRVASDDGNDWAAAVAALAGLHPPVGRRAEILPLQKPDDARFESFLRQTLSGGGKGEAFIFVHGFAVSFEDAIVRTALLASDIKFHGAAIAFDWPSRGEVSPFAYNADGEMARRCEDHLRALVERISAETNVKVLHLIAHSMGGRLLGRVLTGMVKDARIPKNVGEVVFFAPDVPTKEFKEWIPELASAIPRITLYASSRDKALAASNVWNGGVARAGEGGAALLITDGLQSIDVSENAAGAVDHSYLVESQSVVTDLFSLLIDRKAPADRICLIPRLGFWSLARCR